MIATLILIVMIEYCIRLFRETYSPVKQVHIVQTKLNHNDLIVNNMAAI